MLETTAGNLSARQISSHHPFSHHSALKKDYHVERSEELASDDEEAYGYEDEVGELSDSPSSRTSRSSPRPITPRIHPTHIHLHASSSSSSPRHTASAAATSPGISPLPSPTGSTDRFALAHKAERILGLTPGTLSHARACLENARDEVRRLADDAASDAGGARRSTSSADSAPLASTTAGGGSSSSSGAGGGGGGVGGLKGRVARAKKTMSVINFTGGLGAGVGFGGGGGGGGGAAAIGKVPNVVVGAGSKEDEARRERRRKAADGVLYWQKEVGRLQAEETAAAMTTRKGRW